MALRAVTPNGVAISPSSISLPTGGTFDLYNTADQTTNYERLRADWSANIARIFSQNGGTGTTRELRVGATNNTASPTFYTRWTAGGLPTHQNVTGGASAGSWIDLVSGSFTGSSGTQSIVIVAPTINQSGTAGYIALDINPTETATGSGTRLLQRWAVGGTARAQLANDGGLYASGLASSGLIGFGSSLGASADVTVFRDAAHTLALRNGTNAQTFRIYNTYTDASNYERLDLTWSGSQAFIGVAYAGTGAGRELQFVSYGSAAFTLTATAHMALAAGTTARSQINFASSTAPTSPADGDLWFDGTNLKLRVSGTTYTLTKV